MIRYLITLLIATICVVEVYSQDTLVIEPVPSKLDKAGPAGWTKGGNWMNQHEDICVIGKKRKVKKVC